MSVKPAILIIDDEPINRKVLETVFRRDGFEAVSAPDGPTGRQLAAQIRPDLIFLDIMMPGESGFETCGHLKRDPLTTDIPVIFISAVTELEDKVRGLTMGAVDYITKPFENDEVLARARLHIKLNLARSAMVDELTCRLKLLAEAQQAILPRPDDVPGARFAASYRPINEAGGDFYDVFQIGQSIHGYFIADIAGHDVGASFITPALKALISQHASAVFTPMETMKLVNSVMLRMLGEEQHISACYARLNRARFRLDLVSAGHPPAVLVRGDGQARLIQTDGDLLGVFDPVYLSPVQVDVLPGDRLFLYTDGLIEGRGGNRSSRSTGIEELVNACIASNHLPIEQAVLAVMDSVSCESPLDDDATLLVVEC